MGIQMMIEVFVARVKHELMVTSWVVQVVALSAFDDVKHVYGWARYYWALSNPR